MSGIEARMFVKGCLGFGVWDALVWPAGGRLIWFRSGIGGHDREESSTGGGDTLVVSHAVAGPALWGGRGRQVIRCTTRMGVSRFYRARPQPGFMRVGGDV